MVATPRAVPSRTVVPWSVPVLLAVPALATALAITFSGGHSTLFGFVVFGAYALVTAVASAAGALLLPAGRLRLAEWARAALAAAGGATSVALGASGAFDGTPALGLTVGLTLAAIAAKDVWAGASTLRADRFGRDWLAIGVIGAVVALAVLVVPPTYSHAFTVEGQTHVLTASIMVIGILGAGLAVIGVYLAIAGVSLVGRARSSRAPA